MKVRAQKGRNDRRGNPSEPSIASRARLYHLVGRTGSGWRGAIARHIWGAVLDEAQRVVVRDRLVEDCPFIPLVEARRYDEISGRLTLVIEALFVRATCAKEPCSAVYNWQ